MSNNDVGDNNLINLGNFEIYIVICYVVYVHEFNIF